MQKNSNTRIQIILFIGIVVLLAILFVPFEHIYVSDGGSHGCRAITYSVWYQHSFCDPPFGRDESTGMMYTSYITGWTVEIFGIEVYSERHVEKEYTISISEHDATVDAIKQSVNASQLAKSFYTDDIIILSEGEISWYRKYSVKLTNIRLKQLVKE